MDTTRVSAVPGYHPNTIRIIEELKDKPIGTTVNDSEISAIIGLPISTTEGKGYRYLSSAIRYLLKNKMQVWQRLHGTHSIQRVPENKIADISMSHLKRAQREAKKSATKGATVDQRNLTEAERRELNSILAVSGTMVLMSKEKTVKAIQGKDDLYTKAIESCISAYK